MTRRAGRRPGASGTREVIADAARRMFAAHGFAHTSLRAVAAEAGVDPALVTHFYGSKAALFVAATAPPVDMGALLAPIVAGDPSRVGHLVAQLVVRQLEDIESRQRLTGLIRAAASEQAAARLVRERIVEGVLEPVVRALALDRPEIRTAMAGSQFIGLVMARHVVGLPPLVNASADELVQLLAPVFQRWFAEPL